MVCDSHKSADLGVILQRHNIKFQREKKIASLNVPKKTFLSSLFKLCQIICSWAFYQRSAAVSLFSAFWLCVLLHRNVFSWLMMSSLPLLHPSTHSQWGSCQKWLGCGVRGYHQRLCVCYRILFLQICKFVSKCFFVCQRPWQQNKVLIMWHWWPRCTPDSGLY